MRLMIESLLLVHSCCGVISIGCPSCVFFDSLLPVPVSAPEGEEVAGEAGVKEAEAAWGHFEKVRV